MPTSRKSRQKIMAVKALLVASHLFEEQVGIDRRRVRRLRLPGLFEVVRVHVDSSFISSPRAFFARFNFTPTLLSEIPSTSAIWR